tara:strand:- start:384 stop:947 length:564 start_codon:yes stop_codon:yes gene_type:complete
MTFSGNWFSDLTIMESIMDEVEFYSGTERKNMLKKGGIKNQKGSGSMLFGCTWRGYLTPTRTRTKCPDTGLYLTKVVDDNPHLKEIFKEFAFYYFPEFKWSQVQMNKNFRCPPHKDSLNIGESILVSFGDYIGGLTGVEKEDGIVKYDSRTRPIKFNGSTHLHWVEPFEGKRYSLVFFNNIKNRILK